jgi:hypothetical protein
MIFGTTSCGSRAGLDHRRLGRRSQRYRNLFAGRRGRRSTTKHDFDLSCSDVLRDLKALRELADVVYAHGIGSIIWNSTFVVGLIVLRVHLEAPMTRWRMPFGAVAIIASIALNGAVISALVVPGLRPALTSDISNGNSPTANRSTADSASTGNVASTGRASSEAGSADPSASASAGTASIEPPSVSVAPSTAEGAPEESAPTIAATGDASRRQHVSHAKSHRVPKQQVARAPPPGDSSADVAPMDQAPGPLVAPEHVTSSDKQSGEFDESGNSLGSPPGPLSDTPLPGRPLRLVPPPVPQPPNP